MKRIIKVFPDFMSTGLWDDNGLSVSMSNFTDEVTPLLLVALRYWVHTWELMHTSTGSSTISDKYKIEFCRDGETIVKALNESQDGYHFILEPEHI